MATYITTEAVAEYLQIPLSSIYQWRTRGFGPKATRVGRHLRWDLDEVDRWMRENAG